MNLMQVLASQLSHPSGILGKWFLGPIWNIRNRQLNEITLDELALSENDRIIDIGFGGGYLLGRIIPRVGQGLAAGLDASFAMAETCRLRFSKEVNSGQLWIFSGQVEAIPFPDGYFSKACSVNSIFYWGNIEPGITEMYRILQQGGKIVLTFTCREDLEKKGFVRYGIKTYDHEDVRQMIAKAGFGDIQMVKSRDRHREFICMTALKPGSG